MKRGQTFFKLFAITLLIALSSACDKDEDPKPDQRPDLSTEGVYILNSGKLNSNNASLSYFNPKTQILSTDVFQQQNDKKLGDTGQDMLIYGAKMYVAVYQSNIIYVLDKEGNILNSQSPQREGIAQKPRAFAAHKGKVYVSLFDGYLAKIDTATMMIEQQVKVGRNPEQIAIANNKIYVANSGGMDYPNYDQTVSVVDINSFEVSKTIDVVSNPTSIIADAQGNVYVKSSGNYGEIPSAFQKIDSKTDQISVLEGINVANMSLYNDKLYIVSSEYDANWNQIVSFQIFDTKTDKLISENFISDGTKIEKPQSISVDSSTGNIYISTSDYINSGDMYIISPEGKLIHKFDTGGLNPIGAYFVAN